MKEHLLVNLEGIQGIEPWTNWLKVRRSAPELYALTNKTSDNSNQNMPTHLQPDDLFNNVVLLISLMNLDGGESLAAIYGFTQIIMHRKERNEE